MDDLLINSQGQCYVNTNLKFLSVSVLVNQRLIQISKALEDQLQQCQSNKCVSKVQKKLQIFQQKRQQVQTCLNQVKTKMQYEYLLCNDMIYENDIRICRKQAKEKWFKEIGYFMNKTNLPNLLKQINMPN